VNENLFSVIKNVKIGIGTIIQDHVNLFECEIGNYCKIDAFVYIESGVKIGNNCKIRAFSFIPEGVVIEDDVFIGPNVIFANDKYPKSTTTTGELKKKKDWKLQKILVKKGSSIGANATIIGPVVIGKNSIVGAGSVVTKDVDSNVIVAGVPAKLIRRI